MQIPAVSIGSAVRRENFDAMIQSVFDSAANLRLVHQNRLITLLISDHYELPQGIRINTKNLSLQSLTVGLRAASRGGILRFDSSPLAIDLRSASVWTCPIPELNTNMQSPDVIQAWSTAWELLNRGQRSKNTEVVGNDLLQLNTGSLLSQRLGKPVMGLISSVESFDLQGATRAAEKMIGLGPGVTPSGDDILIGFLAGLWSTAEEDSMHLSFIHSFADALRQLAKQTNEISRTYLYYAAQGQFSSSLSTLAEAIAMGRQVEQATQNAIRVGHSSGMDSVTGLLIGLCIWNKQIIPHPVTLPSGEREQEVT